MGIWIIKSLSSGKRTPVITLRWEGRFFKEESLYNSIGWIVQTPSSSFFPLPLLPLFSSQMLQIFFLSHLGTRHALRVRSTPPSWQLFQKPFSRNSFWCRFRWLSFYRFVIWIESVLHEPDASPVTVIRCSFFFLTSPLSENCRVGSSRIRNRWLLGKKGDVGPVPKINIEMTNVLARGQLERQYFEF